MPSYSITAPNGKTYRMQGPPGMTQDDLIEHVLKMAPEAGVAPPPPKTGMGAAFQSGLENMLTSGKAGIKGIFGDTQEAAEEAAAAEKEQAKKYDPQLGLARLNEVYEKSGLLSAGKEMVGQGFRGLAQSAPEMATMLGGAKAGSMAGARFGPTGALIGGIGGGILGGILPHTGRNLAQQETATPGQAELAPALGAGAGQAALESVLPLALMGTRVASKVLGVDAAALIKRLGPEAAEEVAKRSLMRTVAQGTAVGAGGEAATEVVQDMLGRLQAGKPLLDNEALTSYYDSAYGGALVGGGLGGAGGAYNRSGAKQQVAATEQAAAAAAEQEAAAAAQVQQEAAAAERARKMADQGYVQQVADDYAAYEAKKAAMHAEAAEFKKEGTDAGKLAFTDKIKEIAVFEKENRELFKEFNTVARPAIKAAKMRAAAEANAAAIAQQGPHQPSLGTAPGKERGAAGTLFTPEGQSPQVRGRIEELQTQITDHEEALDAMRGQTLEIMRMGRSAPIARARQGIAQREKALSDDRAELESLSPGLQAKTAAERVAAEERASFDPEKAQKQIDALTAKLAGVNDPDEAKKAEGWAKQREKLEAMLAERKKAPPAEPEPPAGEDLFGLGQRLRTEEKLSGQRQLGQERGLEALGAGEATQVWPNLDPRAHEPPGTAYGDTPEAAAAETDAAFKRAFAGKTRSGMLDVLAKAGDEDARFVQIAMQSPIRGAGGAVVEHLASLPASDRKEAARALQDFSKGVVADLYAQLQQARKAGDRAKADDFLDAIRGIAASQEATKGRAHYTSDFYNTTARLIPGVMQGAYEAAGMSAPQATPEQRGRAVAGQQYQVLKDLEERLAGTADPRITRAMEQVGREGEEAFEPVPEEGVSRETLPAGEQPEQRKLPGEDVEGQGMLFQPAAGPAVDPVDAMRQRVASLLARPGLTGQARTTLKHAADALDRPDVPQRVLEHVGATVAAAERGVGGGAPMERIVGEGRTEARTPPKAVKSLAEIGELTKPATERRLTGTLRVAGKKPAASAVAGHLVPETEKIKPQRLETEKPDEAAHIDADVQGDMFGGTYVGRATPKNFQRALDSGALPSTRGVQAVVKQAKERRAKDVELRARRAVLQGRIADAAAAKARLDALGPRLKEGIPNQKEMASALHRRLFDATLAAEDAAAAARKLVTQANEAEAAEEGGGADLRERAAQAGRTARRHSDRVDAYKREIKTLMELDAAPALAETAAHHDKLVKELKQVQAEGLANAEAFHKLPAEIEKAKARAAEKAKAGGEAIPAEPLGARRLPTKQPRVAAPVPTEAEKVVKARGASAADYAARTGEKVTQVQAKLQEAGIEANADAVTEAIETALAVPGVKGSDLKTAIEQVTAYKRSERGFVSEGNKLRKRLSALQDEINAMRKANVGGVLTPALQKRREAALNAVEKLEPQIKATKSADERAKLMDRLDNAQSRLKEFDTKRTPLEEDPDYKTLMARAAVLSFKSDVIDMQRAALQFEEAQVHKGALQMVKTARAARRQKGVSRGVVEPGTKVGGPEDNLTTSQVAKARKAQKTLYSSKKPGPTPAMEEAAKEHRAKAAGEDAAIAARKAVDLARAQRGADAASDAEVAGWEDEGGRVQKLVAEMFDPNTETPLSDQNMIHIYDGQLDKVLESLAKTGSTPLVRELAAKLQVMAKDTKIVLGTPNDAVAIADYDSKTNTITIHPLGLTEENVLHEVGHAATLRSLIMPATQMTQAQINARNGLQALLKQLQADPAFNREYGRTNLAELASEVLSNQNLRDKIDAKKPGFIRRFINAVLQMLGVKVQTGSEKALAQVERLFQPARSLDKAELEVLQDMLGATRAPTVARAAAPQSAMDAFGAKINAKPTKTGLKQMVTDANAALAFEQAYVDQRAGIIKALSKGAQHAFQQAQYYIRKADARMAQVHAVLLHGGPKLKKDAKGFYTVEAGHGPSAKDVFEVIDKLPGANAEAKFALAQNYMVAQRAANKGWGKLGWDTSAETRQLGEAAMAEVNANPQLKAQLEAVRKVYNDYNKGMIEFLADTGSIPKREATRLLQDGDYVPFYRVDSATGAAELVLSENTHVRVGDIRKQPYLAQLKGDEGKLLPLNEAIMRNTMLLMDKGLTNLATKEVAYGLQGMSPENVNRIKRGNAPAGADVIKFNQEPDSDKDTGERWMRITSEGTPFAGIPSEMLVQSLEGTHVMLTGLGKLASNFGDILRHGVTRNPAYVIRQLIRDPMAAAFTGGAERGPVRAMFKSVKEFVDQSRGSTKTGEALLRKGVTQSQVFTGDADDISIIVHQLATGNQNAYTKLKALADRAAMRADAATRSQVYEDTLKKTGSEMQAELAAIEMMNFTKRGSSPTVQHAARMIPFLNAQIQSLNVLAKAWRGNATMEEQMQIRSKFIKNAVGLTLMSMVYAVGMEENEEYKNATAQDRVNNFFVPTPWGTFKLPIPFEIGLLFKAIPEVAVHGFDEAETAALRKMVFNTIPGYSSLGIPQMGKPVVEMLMNKNLYTGRAIETEAQQKLAPEMRYNEHTTELAKSASSLLSAVGAGGLGLSPLKIEALVRGYVSGMPIAAASLANEVLSDASQPTRTGSQTPLLGGFIADPLAAGAVESAYEKANAIEQAGNTYDKLVKEGRVKAAKDYMEDNLNVLQAERLNDSFRADMARAKAEREKVLASSLSSDAKRERIDKITTWRNAQAMRFTKAAESIVAAR